MAQKKVLTENDKKDVKEQEKIKKEREKQLKIKESKERKRIEGLINFPVKTLTEISFLVGCIVFIIKYFGKSATLIDALFYSFLFFTIVYLGVGIIMITMFYYVSEVRKREKAAKKRLEEERRRQEEIRKEEELARLEELQSHNVLNNILNTRNRPDINKGFSGDNIDRNSFEQSDFNNDLNSQNTFEMNNE